jgi:hypothetical protein
MHSLVSKTISLSFARYITTCPSTNLSWLATPNLSLSNAPCESLAAYEGIALIYSTKVHHECIIAVHLGQEIHFSDRDNHPGRECKSLLIGFEISSFRKRRKRGRAAINRVTYYLRLNPMFSLVANVRMNRFECRCKVVWLKQRKRPDLTTNTSSPNSQNTIILALST